MLEGKEVQGKIKAGGKEIGEYSVDITDKGEAMADVSAKHEVAFEGGAVGGSLSLYVKYDAKQLLEKLASKLLAKIPGIGKLFGKE